MRVRFHTARVRFFFDKLRRGHNSPSMWPVARAIYYSFVLDNFRRQGYPEKWAPLKSSTIARRRKGKGSGSPKILMDTGILRAAASSQAGGGYVKTTSRQMEIGTNLSYAGYHHEGTPQMPRRRFYTFDDPLLARMAAAMQSQALRAAYH